MVAFRGAVDVGAHAIETDIHLSKDSVVVLSHVRLISMRSIWYNGLKRYIGRRFEAVFWPQ
jgi:glycerophosphoryl diester phosphodiesterase